MPQNSDKVSTAPTKKQPTSAELRKWYANYSKKQQNFDSMKNALKRLTDITKSRKERTINTFSKEDLRTYLRNISSSEKQLRNLSRYLYYRSHSYYRIINYYANMFDLKARSVIPTYDFTKNKQDAKKVTKQFYTTLTYLDQMNLQYEFLKIYLTCYRQDVFYGCLYWDDTDFFILPLDPDFCKISGVYGTGDFSFAFDFSYFRNRQDVLEYWGEPFQSMYNTYENDTTNNRWQDFPEEYSVCLKARAQDWQTVVPPFSGLFNEIINLEDLKDIQAVADESQIYKLLWFELKTITGSKDVNDWAVDPDLALDYYDKLQNEIPEWADVAMVPGELKSIEFNQDQADDTNKVQKATESVFNTSGGAQILNAASISGTTAFTAAIASDTEFAVSLLLPQTQAWVNRMLSYKMNNPAKVKFFEISIYTRDKLRDALLKSSQFGLPNKLAINTLFGYSEKDTMAMNFLEENCLQVSTKFTPLQSSYTRSADVDTDSITGGRPSSTQITDDGEASKDKRDNAK